MASRSANAYLPRLPYHLRRAGRTRELRRLLLRHDWIETQVRRPNVVGAIADSELLPEDPEIQTLGRSLLLSRDALISNPDQLAFQLHGRLAESSDGSIRDLLNQARRANSEHMWLQPLTASLQRPEAALRWTIRVSQSSIGAVVGLDGGGFACATEGEVRIWNAGAEQSDTVLNVARGRITHIASLSGHRLLSGADDGSIQLWDLESARKMRSFRGHTSAISALVVCDEIFVSAASDGLLLGWHLRDPEVRTTFIGHEKEIKDIAFLDKKHFASVAGDRTLRLWSFFTGKQVRYTEFPVFPGERVAVWKPRHLIAGTFAGEVHAWKITKRSLRRVGSFRYPAAGLSAFLVLKKDLGVSSIRGGRGIRPWNPQTKMMGAGIYVPGGEIVSCAKLDQNTVLCGAKNGYIARVRISPVSADSMGGESPAPVFSVASINERCAASSAGAGKIRVWDPQSGKERDSLQGGDKTVSSVSILSEDRLASAEMGSSEVDIWDPLAGKHVSSIETGKNIGIVHGFSPSILAVAPSATGRGSSEGDESRALDLWDIERRKLLGSIPLPFTVATMVSISGRFLILGTYDNPVLHFDISNHRDRRNFQLKGHSRGVVSLTLLNDGILASGSLDTSIRFWDLEKQECIGVLSGHEKDVTGLVPLTDRYLASASQDQTIRIWDLETSSQIHRVDCDAGLHCIATTPDQQSLVAGDERGQVHFLRVENLGL